METKLTIVHVDVSVIRQHLFVVVGICSESSLKDEMVDVVFVLGESERNTVLTYLCSC